MAKEKDNLDKTQLDILNQKSKDMNQELVQDKMEWYLMQRTQMQNTEISGSKRIFCERILVDAKNAVAKNFPMSL